MYVFFFNKQRSRTQGMTLDGRINSQQIMCIWQELRLMVYMALVLSKDMASRATVLFSFGMLFFSVGTSKRFTLRQCHNGMSTCSLVVKLRVVSSIAAKKEEIMYFKSSIAHGNDFYKTGHGSRLSKNGTISADMDYTAVSPCAPLCQCYVCSTRRSQCLGSSSVHTPYLLWPFSLRYTLKKDPS